jgi:hypothetical protein
VPGSLRESLEDDGRTVVFWNGELTVRGSSMIATRRAEARQQIEDGTVNPHTEFIPDQSGNGYYYQTVMETRGEDGARHVGIVTDWIGRSCGRSPSISLSLSNTATADLFVSELPSAIPMPLLRK